MPAGFEKGDLIDDAYEVIERIGEGGFGDVYRVRQLSMSRDVALKILLQDDEGDDNLAGRFRREVLAVRNLSHPNTVRIFDFSETEEGYLYYTMEYLQGDTLTEHIQKHDGGVPPEQVREILVQVLKSLSEAHSRGIVHRDLKPANIMLADVHGESNFVKVLDFGIAKAANTGSSDLPQQNLTSAENIVGTLRYMAPEQAKEDPLGPYTDLYTLGLVGLELLTGEKVFAGLSNVRILKEQLKPDPIDIPAPFGDTELGRILGRALAKDVDRRYEDAQEMREELEELSTEDLEAARLDELPVTSAPYGESNTGSVSGEPPPISSSHSAEKPSDSAEPLRQTDAGGQGTGSEELRPGTDESEGGVDNGGGIPSPSELQADANEKTATLDSGGGIDSGELEGVSSDTGSGPPPAPPDVPSDKSGEGEEIMELEPEEVTVGEDSGSAPIGGGTTGFGDSADSTPQSAEELLLGDDLEADESTGFDEEDVEVEPEPGVVLGLSMTQLLGAGVGVAVLGVVAVIVIPFGGSGTSEAADDEKVAIGEEADAGAFALGPDAGAEESARADGGTLVEITALGVEAEVYRDGEKLGTTPLEVDPSEGSELELRADGEEKTIVLGEDATSPREVEFEGALASADAGVGSDADAQAVAEKDEEEEEAGGAPDETEEEETASGTGVSDRGGTGSQGERRPSRNYGSRSNQGSSTSSGSSESSGSGDEEEEKEEKEEPKAEEEGEESEEESTSTGNQVPVFQ